MKFFPMKEKGKCTIKLGRPIATRMKVSTMKIFLISFEMEVLVEEEDRKCMPKIFNRYLRICLVAWAEEEGGEEEEEEDHSRER